MYEITLHNSPKFHVKIDATGFMVWGITIKTPSITSNSLGTALSAAKARNTDGVDPGETAINGYIVCSDISDGDDQIAIKGGTTVNHLTIAHNHFGAGHGMSIGSETNGGVSNVNVYDLSIDGTNSGMSGGSSNGIRIKSDSSLGGLVTNVTYSDVCVRDLSNPIIVTPRYTSATGTLIPEYTGITIRDERHPGWLRLRAPPGHHPRQRGRRRHLVVQRGVGVRQRDARTGERDLQPDRDRRHRDQRPVRDDHGEPLHEQVGHLLTNYFSPAGAPLAVGGGGTALAVLRRAAITRATMRLIDSSNA
jgi:hypothetical protein